MKVLKLGLVLLLIVCAHSASAQIGIRAGANFATQLGDTEGVIPIAGLKLGLQYKHELFNGLIIQPEVYFIQKGGKEQNFSPDGEVSRAILINYLEYAVLLRGDITDIGKNGVFYFGVGVHGGYAHSGTYKYSGWGRNLSSESLDLKEEGISRVDYGFGGEIGIEFYKFSLGLRYNHGLQNVVDDYSSDPVFNHGLFIGVGFFFY